MFHEPADRETQPDHALSYKTRLGLIMFGIYSLIYAGFVAINILEPKLMEAPILFGLNLAVVYGFGLIAGALLMALFYNRLCNARENSPRPQHDEETG